MKSYNGRLLRFAMHFLSDKRDAEECVNDNLFPGFFAIQNARFYAFLDSLFDFT